jgi:hypothetical protein
VELTRLGKRIYLWLLDQLFKSSPPGFVLGEDDYKVQPLIKNFVQAVNRRQLAGPNSDINAYRSLEELENALTTDDKDTRTQSYSEKELQTIRAGAQEIYSKGGWQVWKVPQGTSQAGYEAARTLCDNDRHKVKWCVGRGMASTYIPNGDFYVLAKNGVSRYAISSQQGTALTIWNPADTPIFNTGKDSSGGSIFSMKSIVEAARRAGVALTDKDSPASAIPAEIAPILREIRAQDQTLSMIPEHSLAALSKDSEEKWCKILHHVETAKFIIDLNPFYGSVNTVVLAHALMAMAISPKVRMVFSKGDCFNMSDYTILGYIEAMAGEGIKSLPEGIDEAFMATMGDWIKKLEKEYEPTNLAEGM